MRNVACAQSICVNIINVTVCACVCKRASACVCALDDPLMEYTVEIYIARNGPLRVSSACAHATSSSSLYIARAHLRMRACDGLGKLPHVAVGRAYVG